MSKLSSLVRSFRKSPSELLFRSYADKLPRNGIFVDLGANVGNVTGWALDYGHRVYAFEPDPTALTELTSRFGDHPRVMIIPKAVGATSRKTLFHLRPEPGHSQWSSLTRQDFHEGGEAVEVDVVDIVGFIRDLGEPVTLLKMDIEGAEVECLNAIIDAGLHDSIALVLAETHERFSPALAADTEALRNKMKAKCTTNINLDWA